MQTYAEDNGGDSEQAAYVTMVGFTLGLTYGGGLIIKEAKSGTMSHRDVFFGLGFMGGYVTR